MDFTQFPGIGTKKDKLINSMGLKTPESVMQDYPMRYVDRRQVTSIANCEDEKIYVIEAEVNEIKSVQLRQKRNQMVILKVKSHMYQGEIVFFSNYVVRKFSEGQSYYFFGKVLRQGIFFKMQHPEFAPVGDRSFLRIQPFYHLTAGIQQNDMIVVHRETLNRYMDQVANPLPKIVETTAKLLERKNALWEIHFPSDEKGLKTARYRFIYEELFLLQLKLILLKQNYHRPETQMLKSGDQIDQFINTLPFKLTNGQRNAVEVIRTDFISGYAMNRLIQGDVGSGKTIIAIIAMLIAYHNDCQSIMMAPTTVLAEQHYQSIKHVLGEDFPVALLVSSLTAKEKRKIKEEITEGRIKMVVGTQAILQEDVLFDNLALVVTDEQHRFGVRQRFFATKKGTHPHTLVMSATPIPRTLSMILYGDMNVSVIRELPEGRKPIKTHFVSERKKEDLFQFVEEQLQEGRQAYFVCPLVETNDTLDLTSVEELYEQLQKIFPNRKVALIHGKMKPDDKDSVMLDFKHGQTNILVSTTVIEVGVNVPNASIMVIVDAERFGMSQLHQLRGRVGRGDAQSFCFMLSSKLSQEAKKRIETLINTNDGFEIAEKDLELRGPGEIFGLRQHGLPDLKIANLIKHRNILDTVQMHIKLLMNEYNMGNVEVVRYFDQLRATLGEEIVL